MTSLKCFECTNNDNPSCGMFFKAYQFKAQDCGHTDIKCGLQREPPKQGTVCLNGQLFRVDICMYIELPRIKIYLCFMPRINRAFRCCCPGCLPGCLSVFLPGDFRQSFWPQDIYLRAKERLQTMDIIFS